MTEQHARQRHEPSTEAETWGTPPPGFDPESEWSQLLDASTRHDERYGDEVEEYRELVDYALSDEVRNFRTQLEQVSRDVELEGDLDHLERYLVWMKWSTWLPCDLAPALHPVRSAPARWIATSSLCYIGLRLVDDGIDGHETYKEKTVTYAGADTDGRFRSEFEDRRMQSILFGTWLVNYGVQRTAAVGPELREIVQNLLSQTLCGMTLEFLEPSTVDLEDYRVVVDRKSSSYDQILYRGIVEKASDVPKQEVADTIRGVSMAAQILNDLVDSEEDEATGQPNVLRTIDGGEETAWKVALWSVVQPMRALNAAGKVEDALAKIATEVFRNGLRHRDLSGRR